MLALVVNNHYLTWRWLLLASLVLAILFLPLPANAIQPVERSYRIQASQFSYSPSVLYANPGDLVTVELQSVDVVHGFSLDGYNIETAADPGQTERLSFIADKQGTFRFRCTVTCGNMHPFMIGKLQVGRNDLLWRSVLLAGVMLVAGVWGLKK